MCLSDGSSQLFWGLSDKSGFSQQIRSMLPISPPTAVTVSSGEVKLQVRHAGSGPFLGSKRSV